MKKTVEMVVCDICEEELEESDGKCELCKKDVCESCCNNLFNDFEDEFSNMGIEIKPFMICEKCIDRDKLGKELKKFLKQKEIKMKFNEIREQMKVYLTKVAMLNSLKDEGEDEEDD